MVVPVLGAACLHGGGVDNVSIFLAEVNDGSKHKLWQQGQNQEDPDLYAEMRTSYRVAMVATP